MALKDWKMTKKNLYFGNDFVNYINRIEKGTMIMVGKEHGEYYTLIHKSIFGRGDISMKFSSKSKALAYAKSYMRKH